MLFRIPAITHPTLQGRPITSCKQPLNSRRQGSPIVGLLPNSVMRRARRHLKTKTHPTPIRSFSSSETRPRHPFASSPSRTGMPRSRNTHTLHCLLNVRLSPLRGNGRVVVGPRSVQSSLGRPDVTAAECACAGGVERLECVGSNGSGGPHPSRLVRPPWRRACNKTLESQQIPSRSDLDGRLTTPFQR